MSNGRLIVRGNGVSRAQGQGKITCVGAATQPEPEGNTPSMPPSNIFPITYDVSIASALRKLDGSAALNAGDPVQTIGRSNGETVGPLVHTVNDVLGDGSAASAAELIVTNGKRGVRVFGHNFLRFPSYTAYDPAPVRGHTSEVTYMAVVSNLNNVDVFHRFGFVQNILLHFHTGNSGQLPLQLWVALPGSYDDYPIGISADAAKSGAVVIAIRVRHDPSTNKQYLGYIATGSATINEVETWWAGSYQFSLTNPAPSVGDVMSIEGNFGIDGTLHEINYWPESITNTDMLAFYQGLKTKWNAQ